MGHFLIIVVQFLEIYQNVEVLIFFKIKRYRYVTLYIIYTQVEGNICVFLKDLNNC